MTVFLLHPKTKQKLCFLHKESKKIIKKCRSVWAKIATTTRAEVTHKMVPSFAKITSTWWTILPKCSRRSNCAKVV